jgi:hypothetical protein
MGRRGGCELRGCLDIQTVLVRIRPELGHVWTQWPNGRNSDTRFSARRPMLEVVEMRLTIPPELGPEAALLAELRDPRCGLSDGRGTRHPQEQGPHCVSEVLEGLRKQRISPLPLARRSDGSSLASMSGAKYARKKAARDATEVIDRRQAQDVGVLLDAWPVDFDRKFCQRRMQCSPGVHESGQGEVSATRQSVACVE